MRLATRGRTFVRGISVHSKLYERPAVYDPTLSGEGDSLPRSAAARLRILKVTQSYYPFLDRGGAPMVVHALARGLAKKSHEVTVLTSDLGIETARKADDSVAVRVSEGWRSESDSVETIYLSAHGLSADGRYRSLTWNPRVFAFCRERLGTFDIVHIYGTYDLLGPIVARACRQQKIPYVVEPMGMFRPIVRSLAIKWFYRRVLGESVVRGAARLVATSDQEQRELIEEGIAREKIVIRRNGIALPERLPARGEFRRQWKIPQEALVVLFLGRIVSKKSPELLLEAFARWQASSRTTERAMLVIAGPAEDAEYKKRLEAQAKRLGLGGAVLFTGPLYNDAKWAALIDADIFALPSQNENFGNAAAEAVACGTPAIVTDRCGIAAFIEGRAGIVIPHECEALARALHKLSDVSCREGMKAGCAEVARGLSWDEPLAETEALYAELVSQSNRIRN
jgi:glycosyltransferase involved in cell wall biosynthesis